MGKHRKLPEPAQLDRENKVLELRRAGLTWQRIAEEVGYADHTGAYNAYKRAMRRYQEQPREELRHQELDRIDRLQLAAWPKAMQGDLNAIATVLKCIQERCKITGIYEMPKQNIELTVWEGGDHIDRAVKELTELLAANTGTSQGTSAMAGDTSQT